MSAAVPTWLLAGAGAVVLAALLLLAVAGLGRWRWRAASTQLLAQLQATRRPRAAGGSVAAVALHELEGLPLPVQRYLRLVLREGLPLIDSVHLHHSGTFNMKSDGEGWKPFTSMQQVQTQRPGFVWDASVSLAPGLDVRVHDADVGGRGVLHAAVLGAVPVARLSGGGDLAQGELMRWLAESPWYPTVLLPSQGVQWQAVDSRSADATVVDGEVTVTLRFRFDSDGFVDTVTAAARGRLVGRVVKPAPWQGRFWNYALRSGLRVPLQGEVAWLLPGGASPYWRGRITSIVFDPSEAPS